MFFWNFIFYFFFLFSMYDLSCRIIQQFSIAISVSRQFYNFLVVLSFYSSLLAPSRCNLFNLIRTFLPSVIISKNILVSFCIHINDISRLLQFFLFNWFKRWLLIWWKNVESQTFTVFHIKIVKHFARRI